ncbi:DNA replication licensing factor MCM7-like protein [Drosera capensis]
MKVAVYTCEDCGFEIYQICPAKYEKEKSKRVGSLFVDVLTQSLLDKQEVTARSFMPLFQCPSRRCDTNKSKGSLILQLRASKALKFQEAKIQELAEHVPKGHIPRAMTVHFRGELTRKVTPGDVVKTMLAWLHILTWRPCLSLISRKKYEDYELQGDEEEQIAHLAEDGDIYNKLAKSLAPEIFGHEDAKKALFFCLSVLHTESYRMECKLEEIYTCLMGDPGVAKSQLLKHIINVAPRGAYTTGRGSSGVGLTAAVQKDPVTNEFVLEGGALVLADMGICAIDEFDKMDDSDRTAIHEVMEQQTVSIAKAGITTSLNARTAILAAANPAWGRYDLRRTPAENINLPPALLSRFDLLWAYIATAYSSIKQEEFGSDTPISYTTVIALLCILRLRFSATVEQSDIDEALRLMQMPKFSFYSEDHQKSGLDAISDIYSILRDEAARTSTMDINYAQALNWISRKGYSEAQLKECLEEYAAFNVWQIRSNTFDIKFIDA